jgi:DNA polymerase-3 subunit epsilon
MIGIIDIETTGFLPDGKIVEVGIAGLEDGKVHELFSSVCREPGLVKKDRDAWIFNNSDLTVEAVREAPLLSDLQDEIQSILDEIPCTAYNKKFDFGFLRDRGFRIENELDCPMIIATDILKLPGKKWSKDFKYPSVEEAWDYFMDEPYVEAHRGLDDAKHEALIVWELYKRGFFVTEENRNLWTAS